MIYFSANLVHKIIFSKKSYMTSFGLRANIYPKTLSLQFILQT